MPAFVRELLISASERVTGGAVVFVGRESGGYEIKRSKIHGSDVFASELAWFRYQESNNWDENTYLPKVLTCLPLIIITLLYYTALRKQAFEQLSYEALTTIAIQLGRCHVRHKARPYSHKHICTTRITRLQYPIVIPWLGKLERKPKKLPVAVK